MGILKVFQRLNRKLWFVCHACMQQTSHDALRSIFYYEGPPTLQRGRPFIPCPRCRNTNTVSFQQLEAEGSRAQLWGLEQAAKQHSRHFFEIKPDDGTTAG